MPRLRFPEFLNAEEWEAKRLGELFSERQETNFPSLPLLSLTERNGIIPQEQGSRANTASGDKSKYLRVIPGDIAYNTMRMWEGRSALVGLEGIVSPAYTVCIPQKGNSSSFFSYYFKTQILIEKFHRCSQGLVNDTLNLKFKAFEKITVFSPRSFREQQKIADFLSSLDERITAETSKLDRFKDHKKGLLKQLFPAEGETLPALRFPKFRNAGEWEEGTLGEISTVTSGGTPSRVETCFWNGHIPWVTTSLIDFCVIYHADECITNEGLKGSSAKLFPKGTVLMAMYGQGKTRGKVALLGIEAATNQACAAILLGKKLNEMFVFQNLSSRYEEIRDLSNSGGQENLSIGLISKILVSYPKAAEQQKIADCLSSLDELITAQGQKIELLKIHKKGLMQQLFPVHDEAKA